MRALRILDSLIQESPNQLESRMARGYVHEAAKRWELAIADFERVTSLAEQHDSNWLEAAEESAWCQIQNGEKDAGIESIRYVLDILDNLEENEEGKGRIWWRLGKAIWNEKDPSTFSESYKCWITSLKRCSTFASSFTALGVYYADYAEPRDALRASRCLQKAFELDAREVEAARRLAEGFVDDKEWDLAEIVARRTIEGEGGSEVSAGQERLNTRHIPANSWAWKVLGLVDFVSLK